MVWCFSMMDVAASIRNGGRSSMEERRAVTPLSGVRFSSVTPAVRRGDHMVRLLQPPACPLKRLKPVRLLRALRGLGC